MQTSFAAAALLFVILAADPPAAEGRVYRSTPGNGDRFGFSVAASDGRLIVGAPGDDADAGNPGTVFVFDVATGGMLATITSPAADGADDQFGFAVDSLGPAILVGAPGDDSAGPDAGAAYLFDEHGTLLQSFRSPMPSPGEAFGFALALSTGRVLIGAPAPGQDLSGRAYLFDRETGTCLHRFQNPGPTADDLFGAAVLLGSSAVIGSPFDDWAGEDAGAVYRFTIPSAGDCLEPADTVTVPRLVAPFPMPGDLFGTALAGTDADLFVGAPFVDTRGPDVGAAFRFDGPNTLSEIYLPPRVDVEPAGKRESRSTGFGTSIAVVGSRVLIGAPLFEVVGFVPPFGFDLRPEGGSAYLFDAEGGSPETVAGPERPAGARFGFAVGVVDDLPVVGMPGVGEVHVPRCGDGALDSDERCDDGNTAGCDGCTATCRPGPFCGDGFVDAVCGEQCDDGNETNLDGCTADCLLECRFDFECDDQNSCTRDSCDPVRGCQRQPITGTLCDDGNPCTAALCIGGICEGVPVPDGTPCRDDNVCNGLETCEQGRCIRGERLECPLDDNPCTIEICDPIFGCDEPLPVPDGWFCEDGDPCNGLETCQAGACTPGTPPPNGTICEDSEPCNGVETCHEGVCTPGTPLPEGGPCDPLGPPNCICQKAVCECMERRDCSSDIDCDDGDACNGAERCVDRGPLGHFCGSGVPAPDLTPCDDGVRCTENEMCRDGVCIGTPVRGCCQTDADCDDGDPCNGAAECFACVGCQIYSASCCGKRSKCKPGTGRPSGASCDDGNPCTEADRCEAGICRGAPKDCSALDSGCSTGRCDVDTGTCEAGVTPDCSHLNGECRVGACDPEADECQQRLAPPGSPCDDGDACSVNDACTATGTCAGEARACDDGDPCTSDGCDAAACGSAGGCCVHTRIAVKIARGLVPTARGMRETCRLTTGQRERPPGRVRKLVKSARRLIRRAEKLARKKPSKAERVLQQARAKLQKAAGHLSEAQLRGRISAACTTALIAELTAVGRELSCPDL